MYLSIEWLSEKEKPASTGNAVSLQYDMLPKHG